MATKQATGLFKHVFSNKHVYCGNVNGNKQLQDVYLDLCNNYKIVNFSRCDYGISLINPDLIYVEIECKQ